MPEYAAVIVGAGPNGLAAAITLARQGRRVLVLEAKDAVGGGTRTAELTLPGFKHDICSAIHPLGVASPFMRSLSLEQHGVEWIFPPAALAHPFDNGPAVTFERSVDKTADQLGADGRAYRRLVGYLAERWQDVVEDLLGPLPLPPRHPLVLARFAMAALLPAAALARLTFAGPRARGIFAGLAAHAMLPLDQPATAAYGLTLGMLTHGVGWPMAKGGSQAIADAMSAILTALGGEVRTGFTVHSMADLPPARAYLFDLTPRQLVRIAGDRLPDGYKKQLARYRYGPGVFKIDYALSAPVPWKDPACQRAATVHLGGSLEEIAASESAPRRGEHASRPYVLFVQQTPFDPSRAPAGQHIAWAYCHVPSGSSVDMTCVIEAQIERFAPGFGDVVLERSTRNAAQMEIYNPNYIGGDINGGVQDLLQLYTRPVARLSPYTTPAKNIFICSSSTPPGGGVHGMCGYHAAQAALRTILK
ncbi:MAG: NAD(P)/FAD-dependent oxidoreductase [Anaerolineaceae bacterium]|nr:NAD(P)/FAD-dependent oxidoreductase [Anaerolineaceae bacterium]